MLFNTSVLVEVLVLIDILSTVAGTLSTPSGDVKAVVVGSPSSTGSDTKALLVLAFLLFVLFNVAF